jgi:hypothetical protein
LAELNLGKVVGPPGEEGHSPYIGDNGNWYEWKETAYIDTGVNAEGTQGPPGPQGKQGDKGEKGDPGSGGVEQTYVDDKDAQTLQQAKAYTDSTSGNLPGGAMSGQAIVADANGAPVWKLTQFSDVTPDGYPVGAWYVMAHANYALEVTGTRSFNYYAKSIQNGARIDINIADIDGPIYFDFDIAFDQEVSNIWFGTPNLSAAPRLAYVNSGHNTVAV